MNDVITARRVNSTHKQQQNSECDLLQQFKATTESLRHIARNQEQHRHIDVIVAKLDNEGLSRENRLAAINLFSLIVTNATA